MKQLASGFFNQVFVNKSKTLVFKVPLLTSFLTGETKEKLIFALGAHRKYLDNALPKTEIKSRRCSPRGYLMVQEFIEGEILHTKHLQADQELQAQFAHLVKQGIAMEKDKKIFFDIFGRNGFIKNQSQFFKKDPNFMYSNCILTPANEIKFIDVGYLPMNNPMARCAKHLRDFTNYIHKKKYFTHTSK